MSSDQYQTAKPIVSTTETLQNTNPASEQVKDSKIDQNKKVSFFQLFRFTTKMDIILILVGSLAALSMGAAIPVFDFLWGQMTDTFAKGGDPMVEKAKQIMYVFFGIGGGVLVFGWLMIACWTIAGERQSIACRKAYFKSLLRQQVGWFDTIDQSQLASQFATDCFAYQGCLGEKNATVLMTVGMFISGFAMAFSIGWLMTVVILATIPLIGITGYIFMWSVQVKDKRTSKDYAQAGSLAQQALSAIKTVKMLNGQQFQTFNYQKCLIEVTKKSIKYAAIAGLGIGGFYSSMLFSYALGFWFGSHCVEGTDICKGTQKYTAGDVMVVFYSTLMIGFIFSQLTPALRKIAQGKQAAARIFKIIDRQPEIKNIQNPIRPTQFRGLFKFENVTFTYPKNKSQKVLKNISIEFNTDSCALVGESGCGKSTVLQLLMRFYDPDKGKITLDGVDLKQLDLAWLRENIGYVSQEPVLFATSIRQNLSFGKKEVTDQEIYEALKKAQAYDFVQNLDQKLQTYVGTGGNQLSGGQKQRIAIARALLRNPKILLFDEATSALDRKNQRSIQATLDIISKQRTTITVAHQTKTIMNCSMIYVLHEGKVLESGQFKQLKRFKDIKINKDEHIQKKKENIDQLSHINPQTNLSGVQKFKNGQIDFTTCQMEEKKQLSKEKMQKAQKQSLLKKHEKGTFRRIFAYGKTKIWAFAIAIIMAMVNGAIFPIFSIFGSKMLATFIQFLTNPQKARKDANLFALIYVILAIVSLIVNFFQIVLFSHVGQQITKRIRVQCYGKMLRMPIPWHDVPKNHSGELTARLASDCKQVNGLTTTFVGITIQNIVTLIASLLIGFLYEWRTALVTVGLIPIMVLAGVMQMHQSTGFSSETDKAYKDSAILITEAMNNIRTVISFGYENIVLDKYSEKLVKPCKITLKRSNVSGFLFGLTQLIMFYIFAIILYLGAVFIRNDPNIAITDVFTAIYSIVFGAITVGNNAHFLPDVAAAKQAASNLFEIIDGEDEDQIQVRQKSSLLKQGIDGNIQFKNITFKYETRNSLLFKNFNLSIHKGTKVAFVGHSGCGKSTIFQMILRFYDPSDGQILIDGQDIKNFDIHYLRKCFGVVSQEPTLFNQSFRYNIIYNLENVQSEEMIQAAKEANALDFIRGLQILEGNVDSEKRKEDTKETLDSQSPKNDFSRNVGIKGSHISGGQKQRIAIARSLLRKPAILLLDEATSALDRKNQVQVQNSLDKLMKNRTTITIAHKIDTIKNSDEINVFDSGKIVQKGNYWQLIDHKGYFYNLERGTEFSKIL